MFKPASSTGVLFNNENASAVHRSSKSIVEKGMKKASFNDENVKTPHRSNTDAAIAGKGGEQTAQRRRRAFGRDISNRGQAGGEAGSKGDLASKQSSSKAYGNNTKASFPPSSTANRVTQVAFSKTTFAESVVANSERLGGGSGAKGADAKPKSRSSGVEHDGVFKATTRWASDDVRDEIRSPFDLVPEDELYMFSKLRDESSDLRKKENDKRDRLELQRCEMRFMEQIRAVQVMDEKDMKHYGGIDAENGADESSAWDLLDRKLPWEEEDGDYDPAEERRLSGSDPLSLWGDVSNY
jgi:hypothetical protein